jgi:hypothetical protein
MVASHSMQGVTSGKKLGVWTKTFEAVACTGSGQRGRRHDGKKLQAMGFDGVV